MDYRDKYSSIGVPNKEIAPKLNIDRHDCLHLDANHDGAEDIVCVVGANKGKGYGFNELYLTYSDGSLVKVMNHGLQKYKAMRTRITAKLKHASGSHLIFIGTNGVARADGRANSNKMFRSLKTGKQPYFVEFPGPWDRLYGVSSAHVTDVNKDGRDDLILCGGKDHMPRMYVQTAAGGFKDVHIRAGKFTKGWQNVRVAYITMNERPDLVSVDGGLGVRGPSYIRIFRGMNSAPYFDFSSPYYSRELPHAAPDLEIMDVNKDGWKDIYVVQANQRHGYCAARGNTVTKYWPTKPWPDKNWVPPVDSAQDIVLIGSRDKGTGRVAFKSVKINFPGRGCGSLVKRFGSFQKLIVTKGRNMHSGYNYLYEW